MREQQFKKKDKVIKIILLVNWKNGWKIQYIQYKYFKKRKTKRKIFRIIKLKRRIKISNYIYIIVRKEIKVWWLDWKMERKLTKTEIKLKRIKGSDYRPYEWIIFVINIFIRKSIDILS